MTSADSETGEDTGRDTGLDTDVDTDTGDDLGDDPGDDPGDYLGDDLGDEPVADTAAEDKRAAQWPTIALSVSIALVVAAAAVAVWFGIAWFKASNDDGIAYSGNRDEVDRVARAAIVTMNTLDYRKLDEGLSNWADATTGPLHDEITGLTADKKKQLTDAKPVTSAKITSSAVKELDDRGGKATVIAAIEKTVQTAKGKPQQTFQRISASLTRTKDGWKLDNLGPVAYAQPR